MGGGAVRAAEIISRWPERVEQDGRRAAFRRVPAAHRRRGRALFGCETAGPRDYVRSSLCRTAEGLCRATPGTRGEQLMPEATLVEAINLALARAMEDDPNLVVFAEDFGGNGGGCRATVGL